MHKGLPVRCILITLAVTVSVVGICLYLRFIVRLIKRQEAPSASNSPTLDWSFATAWGTTARTEVFRLGKGQGFCTYKISTGGELQIVLRSTGSKKPINIIHQTKNCRVESGGSLIDIDEPGDYFLDVTGDPYIPWNLEVKEFNNPGPGEEVHHILKPN